MPLLHATRDTRHAGRSGVRYDLNDIYALLYANDNLSSVAVLEKLDTVAARLDPVC